MPKTDIKTKEQAISTLTKLPDDVLIRVAKLSDNPKAIEYFESPLKYGILTGMLDKFS
ncbi:protein of unknown function [Tenacibaculum litopenaei]|uniref:hypothetical protein n=1 Tax=Tenacibaculum litopenaei TaxID=396016 RepID=UPI0038963D3C